MTTPFDTWQNLYAGFLADGRFRSGKTCKAKIGEAVCSFWLKSGKSNLSVKLQGASIFTVAVQDTEFREFDLLYAFERIQELVSAFTSVEPDADNGSEE